MKEGTKELFDKLYNESDYAKAEIKKKETLKKALIIALVVFAISCVFSPFIFIAIIAAIIYVIVISKNNNKVNNKSNLDLPTLYKDEIVKPLLEYNFDGIQYMGDEGMLLEEYLRAQYIDRDPRRLDRYRSNDHIILPIQAENNNLEMDIYDVCLQRIHRDSEGKTSTETIFQGFTGTALLPKNISGDIKLKFEYSLFNMEAKRENEIELDMSEFEKHFDLMASDKILAMRIFTAEVMQELLKIYKESKRIYDINIIDNKLYIRIQGFNIFEPQIVINGSSYDIIKEGILILEEFQKLTKLMYNTINNVEI